MEMNLNEMASGRFLAKERPKTPRDLHIETEQMPQ